MESIMSFILSGDMQNVLAVIIGVVALPFIYQAFGYLLIKGKNYYVQEATLVVRDVVVNLTQTIVDELKKKGEWTEERQIEVFNKAFDMIVALVSERAKKVITKAFGDFETWAKLKIDVIVKDEKVQK